MRAFPCISSRRARSPRSSHLARAYILALFPAVAALVSHSRRLRGVHHLPGRLNPDGLQKDPVRPRVPLGLPPPLAPGEARLPHLPR
jgi:hypothetical protein